jgi:DNA-binding response OmpR family regulator
MRSVLLVVDGADRLAPIFASALCDHTIATDADQALRLARVVAFDVVVIDVTSPRLDGCNLGARLRRAASGRPITVIALGRSPQDRVPEGFDRSVPLHEGPALVEQILGRRSQPYEIPQAP